MNNKIEAIRNEVRKAIVGKDEVIDRTLTAILAGGHILLDDIPGVGKTTMAVAFSKAMGLEFNRVQFTPDVVPSDITGFSMYNKESGSFEYKAGAAMCNFLLADEINRTSSKTQSALLEVMQEGKITVDGVTHEAPLPFIVMATQNPIGAAGTQMLPEAQLDRFMIQISMGYPDIDGQIRILSDRTAEDPMSKVEKVVTADEIMEMKKDVANVYTDVKVLKYIAELAETSRNNEYVKLGLSPRGAIAIMHMAKAGAYMEGRDYITPQDVVKVFYDAARHRVMLNSKAQLNNLTKEDILKEIIEATDTPRVDVRR
ncbi:MAG: MoxR family ATPase [Peptostreptococcaceae bacterium]|nr:MoxR family ATPase [Peptostreptococcaceae bacterium]MDY5738505.1 MoxR family ATPase [Anaerovoracaceae bacterium]SFE58212.1 MoxR-like ATPase [Peptostreptococcaceae bacterium pGA-8]